VGGFSLEPENQEYTSLLRLNQNYLGDYFHPACFIFKELFEKEGNAK